MSNGKTVSILSTKTIPWRGRQLYRIMTQSETHESVALRHVGGWVESESNIADDAWIDDDARVMDSACARGNSLVIKEARMTDRAIAEGHATLSDHASMQDDSRISGRAFLSDSASTSGSGRVDGGAMATGSTQVCGNARLGGGAWADGETILDDDAVMDGASCTRGWVTLRGQSHLGGDVRLIGTHLLDADAEVTSSHHYVVIPSMAPRMPSVTAIHTRSEPIFRLGESWENMTREQVEESLRSEEFQGENKGPALTVLGLLRDLVDRWEDEDRED